MPDISKNDNPSPNGAASKKPDLVASTFEWIELFVYAFAFVLVVMTFGVRHSPVIGSSMYSTLEENDVLIISNVGYTPDNGDIIVFQSPGVGFKEPLVKRIIATAGQEVNIDFSTWTVLVDGEKVDESYVNYEAGRSMVNYNNGISFPLTVPEGCIFVMGDNRNHSLDSRSSTVGLVDERYVIGHVIFRLLPFNKIGTVD